MEQITEYLMLFISLLTSVIGFFLVRFIKKVDKLEDDFIEHKEKDISLFLTKEEAIRIDENYKEFIKELISPLNRKLESIEVHLRSRRKTDT